MRLRLRHGTALLALAFALNASAQRGRQFPSVTPRTIQGQVVNNQNRPVPWAYVSLQGEMGGVASSATTGPSGRFRFERVEADIYVVVVEMVGYHRAAQRVDMTTQFQAHVLLTLYPDKNAQPAQPASNDPIVPIQSLTIPDKARDEFQKGREALLTKDDPAASEEHFLRAIELYSSYVDAYQLLGASYLRQEKWKEAETAFQRALDLNPSSAPAYFGLAGVYKERHATDEARDALEHGLRLDPNSWRGHLELAQLLLAEEKVAEAEEHARRAHELASKDPLACVVLANVVLRENDLKTAREEYQHYLELAPAGPLAEEIKAKIAEISKKERQLELLSRDKASVIPEAAREEFNKGSNQVNKGQFDEALRHFRRAVEIAPSYLEAHLMVGSILLDQEKWSEAEQDFRGMLDIDDNYAPAYVALGRLYNMKGAAVEAEPLLRQAVELDPDSWQGHFELAQSLLTLHKLPESEMHARQAQKLQEGFPLVYVLLGNISLAKHDARAARDQFQRYIDLAPNGPLASQLKKRIMQIDAALARQAALPSSQP